MEGLVVMSPAGGESNTKEAGLLFQLSLWNHQQKLGVVFSSSTIFSLPKGGDRSPDAAWVSLSRWEKLSQAEREGFHQFALILSLNCAQKAIASRPYKTKC